MITMTITNPDEFKRKTEAYYKTILTAVADRVLGQLAEKTVTSITSGIDRQRSIDGGILKQNTAETTARKLGQDRVIGVPVRIGKKAKASFGGLRQARSLVDKGILRKTSTYDVKRISPTKYEVSIRAVKSADPNDKTTRDLVGGYVQDMGYNFFGIPKVIVQNVNRLVQNELRLLLPNRL